jgi:NAD-dependent deacetylase
MRIVILTGAGLSAESGLGTFRDEDGLWTKFDLKEVATPEGYARDPVQVLDFYNMRRRNAREAEPNAAHGALGRLVASGRHDVTIITQNIDDLHERGGVAAVNHIHGSLFEALCADCGHVWPHRDDMTIEDACPECETVGTVRPNIVWFGEIPYNMDEAVAAIEACDLFVSIGTSGTVYPAAGFVDIAHDAGARTLELNLEASDGAFGEVREGPATSIVPAWVAGVLSGNG